MTILKTISFLLTFTYLSSNQIRIHQVAHFTNLPFNYSMSVKYGVTFLSNEKKIYKLYTPGIRSLTGLRNDGNSFLIQDENGTTKITLFEDQEPKITLLKKDSFEKI